MATTAQLSAARAVMIKVLDDPSSLYNGAVVPDWNALAQYLNSEGIPALQAAGVNPAELARLLNVVVSNINPTGIEARRIANVLAAMTASDPPPTDQWEADKAKSFFSHRFLTQADLGPEKVNRGQPFYWERGTFDNPTVDEHGCCITTRPNGGIKTDNCGGSFYFNFAADYSKRIKSGSPPLFIKFKWRCDQAYATTVFLDNNGVVQAGVKTLILTNGDTPTVFGQSCTAVQIVLTDYYNNKIWSAYNSCRGSASHGAYSGFYDYDSTLGQWLIQNALACSMQRIANCFKQFPDEDIEVQLMVDLSASAYDPVACEWTRSVFKLWAKRAGQDPVLLIDWSPGKPKYFQLTASNTSEDENGVPINPVPAGTAKEQAFAKGIFTCYITNKNATQVHPVCHQWMNDILLAHVSLMDTEEVPPVVTPPAGNPTLAAILPGTGIDLGVYNPVQQDGESGLARQHTCDYSGMRYHPGRRVMAKIVGGGHRGSNNNGLACFSLDDQKWRNEVLPTPLAVMTPDNWDATLGAWKNGPDDGGPAYPRPASRHNIGNTCVVGDEVIVPCRVEGNAEGLPAGWVDFTKNTDTSHQIDTPARVVHYNFVTKQYSFSPTAEGNFQTGEPKGGDLTLATNWPCSCEDPVSGMILQVSRDRMDLYDPVAKVKIRGRKISDANMGADQNVSYFPPNDKFYYVHQSGGVWEIALNRTDPSKSTIVRLAVTGALPTAAPNEVGIFYDPVNKRIGMSPVDGKYYAFDPLTRIWTASTLTLPANCASGEFHNCDFDPINGVAIYISQYPYYRTVAFRPPPAV